MRRRELGSVAIFALAALSAACTDDKASLVVDLRTDLVPRREFATVRQVITGPMLGDTSELAVSATADYVTGHRVGEYESLPPGRYVMTTQLLDAARAIVAQRVTDLHLSGDLAVTVVVSRDCRATVCPGASDAPSATTCAGGRCVDPTCTSADPTTCPPGCSAATDCAPRAACSAPRCASGVCLYAPVVACGSGLVCDPDVGCVPDGTGAPDAGRLDGGALDAGAFDAGPPDAGVAPGDAGFDAATTGCGVPGTTTEIGSCCNGGTRERDVTCNMDGTTSTGTWSGCRDDGCGTGECCGGLRCRAC